MQKGEAKMKKVLATIAVIGCMSAAGTALAGVAAGTGVNGSLHDMTKVVPGTADDMGRVCVYCHTPHHAVVKDGSANLPLWNHTITPDNQFTPYTWATPNNSNDGAFDIIDPLAGPSRLCMSCHDGSIAVDEHGSAFAQAGGTTIATVNNLDYQGRANLTKDLSNTHPIGFDYNDIAAFRNSKSINGTGSKVGGEFADGTEIVVSTLGYATGITLNNTVQGQYNQVDRAAGGKRIADNLYGGNIMTCATCHEVHNKENATQVAWKSGPKTVLGTSQAAPNYFLYAKEDQSLICLSCHVK
jgi:hypothetical protein